MQNSLSLRDRAKIESHIVAIAPLFYCIVNILSW